MSLLFFNFFEKINNSTPPPPKAVVDFSNKFDNSFFQLFFLLKCDYQFFPKKKGSIFLIKIWSFFLENTVLPILLWKNSGLSIFKEMRLSLFLKNSAISNFSKKKKHDLRIIFF